MDLINIWKIVENDKLFDFMSKICSIHESNMTYLLNNNIDNNIDNIIEKTIYDIANFHFKNMNLDIKNQYVEFWFKTYSSNINTICHTDCDEYDRHINKNTDCNKPLLSCITYLNDNFEVPTLIMNIDDNDYKYKNFENKKIILSFPKKYKQITFNGGNYLHGLTYLDSDNRNIKRDILVINMWNEKPLNVPFFDYKALFFKYVMNYKYLDEYFSYINIDDPLIVVEKSTCDIANIVLNSNTLNSELFETILFTNCENKYLFEDFKTILENKHDTFIFENEEVHIYQNDNITCDTNNKINNSNLQFIDVDNVLKFKQRFIYEKHFTRDICKWIINECDKYGLINGWTNKRHELYPTTDIPVENIQSIFNFILISFSETIIHKIKKCYELDDTVKIRISDLFVVKYEHDKQSYLELHSDTSCVTVNILLSDISDFTGGGTFFEDNLTISLNQGDMLIHSSKTKHAGLQITSGKRYVLVFFIDLYS